MELVCNCSVVCIERDIVKQESFLRQDFYLVVFWLFALLFEDRGLGVLNRDSESMGGISLNSIKSQNQSFASFNFHKIIFLASTL